MMRSKTNGRFVNPIPWPARFWWNVDFTGSPIGCWIWLQYKRPDDGHGIARNPQKRIQEGAHRIAWELTNGSIPKELSVLHRCDNPPCVNPEHLFLGTIADNIHDCIEKGRRRYAKNNATLTWSQVEEIRRSYAKDDISQCDLARKYGIRQTSISNIILNKTWKPERKSQEPISGTLT